MKQIESKKQLLQRVSKVSKKDFIGDGTIGDTENKIWKISRFGTAKRQKQTRDY